MSKQPKPRWPLIVVSALFVMVAATGVFAYLWDRDQNPSVIVRDDPIADLLGWIPATEETRESFAVWTPENGSSSNGTPSAVGTIGSKALAMEPSIWMSNSPASKPGVVAIPDIGIEGWVMAGTDDPVVVFQGHYTPRFIEGPDKSESYRGATIYRPDADLDIRVATGFLEGRVILANSVDQVKAAIDAAVGKRESLAEDETITSLMQTFAPSHALMVKDAAKQAVACAQGDESTVEPSSRFVAIAYGRIGEGGQPRTLVATSFDSEEEAASAEAAYELGWQDGYVLAGNSGAPIANFATVSHVSQTGNLLIAELVDGREDGWTRAAIRFATPVCEAVNAAVSDTIVYATPQVDEPSALERALSSLPDPGLEGVTLAADLAAASDAVNKRAPDDQNIRAEDIEAWLSALGPIPSFDAFPSDGTKLARWPETFGISLGSIDAVSEIHRTDDRESAAVLIGSWDPEDVEDHLTNLGYVRTDWGAATIYTFTRSLEDPSLKLNLAAGPAWGNVAIYGDRIFVSPYGRTLREVLDVALGEDHPGVLPSAVYLREWMLDGKPVVTMIEIAGREFMNDLCVELEVSGVEPDWSLAAALWSAGSTGGTGEIVIIPDGLLTEARQTLDRQITRNRTLVSADSEPTGGSFSTLFDYQEVQQAALSDGTAVLVAKFAPLSGESTAKFFAESVEGCRFGAP